MDPSISLATAADSWKVVARAEALGFSEAWFYDTQMLNADPFVAMGAAAMRTERIRLGTGVLVPSNRIAPSAAAALASLNALAPGRVDFGVGSGNTARRAMGQRALKLADLAEYVRVVQGLLAGETLEWTAEDGVHKIRFLNPEVGVVNIVDPIPLFISAFGAKSRRLVARLGAGWIVAVQNVEAARVAMADMRKAWEEAGRAPADLVSVALLSGCVLADGEAADSPRAKAQAGPAAANFFHHAGDTDPGAGASHNVPAPFRPLVEAYMEHWRRYVPADARYLTNHRGHLMFLRPEEEFLVTADLIRATTFTATAPELRDRLRALSEIGFTQCCITVRHGHPDMLEDWRAVLDGV